MRLTLNSVLGFFAVVFAGFGFFVAFGAIFAVSHMAIDTLKAVL